MVWENEKNTLATDPRILQNHKHLYKSNEHSLITGTHTDLVSNQDGKQSQILMDNCAQDATKPQMFSNVLFIYKQDNANFDDGASPTDWWRWCGRVLKTGLGIGRLRVQIPVWAVTFSSSLLISFRVVGSVSSPADEMKHWGPVASVKGYHHLLMLAGTLRLQ